jgi:hypothetical protein
LRQHKGKRPPTGDIASTNVTYAFGLGSISQKSSAHPGPADPMATLVTGPGSDTRSQHEPFPAPGAATRTAVIEALENNLTIADLRADYRVSRIAIGVSTSYPNVGVRSTRGSVVAEIPVLC